MKAGYFHAFMKIANRVNSDFANVGHTGEGNECRCTIGEGSGLVSPFNSHGHEGLNPWTRAIMFDMESALFDTVWVAETANRHSSSEA